MPHISQRAQAQPPSPIRKLVPLANAAKARGTSVLHLNIGQPDLPTPPEFYQAIAAASPATLEYSPSGGLDSYRKALATYYGRFGLELKSEEVLITSGGSEALLFAFMVCLNPGEEVIIPEPFYANYNGFANIAGVKVVPVPGGIDQDYALPSAQAFAERIGPNTRAILLCNPSNPTGKLYSRADLEALAALVQQHDLYLISDEVYKEFVYDGQAFTSVLSLRELDQRAIVADSISKRYSACGARIGSLVSRNPTFVEAALRMAQARLSPPSLGQIGSEALCSLPDSYYEGVRQEYVARRDVVLRRLKAMPGVLAPHVSGAFYVMPELPVHNADEFCHWLLTDFSHEGQTIMLAPGSGFYASPGGGQRQVRIAYVLETPKLERAMDLLELALQQYPGKL